MWRLDGHGTRELGSGPSDRLALFLGRGGHNSVAGAVAAGMRRLPAGAEAAALDGGAVTVAAAAPGRSAAKAAADGAGLPPTPLGLLPTSAAGGHAAARSWLPDVAAPATTALPAGLPGRARADTFSSTCAVPRNHVDLQVMQPSAAMVDWAANLAGRGTLTRQRPAKYANLGLSAYAPSTDFPLPAPFGAGGKAIPREVLDAVFAQESNFKQASWHSIQGLAGNPLVADYYGAGGGYVPGVQTPDCGYGLGQVTTGMTKGAMSYDLQRKVAVDYAEDAAAAAQILAQKWNELAAAGITANGADPATLENWFLALWDYNSGLHPSSDGTPWGLGWLNNPANPVYPYNRHPFLHEDWVPGAVLNLTYDDASHPGDWPYEEKVFGWMEIPQIDSLSGLYSYAGTIEYAHDGINDERLDAYELARPGRTAFCDATRDQCDPSSTDGAGNPSATCHADGSRCWWHYPVQWCGALNLCHGGEWTDDPSAAEPTPTGATNWFPPICELNTDEVPAGSVIVDSQADGLNLEGCNPANANWHSSGSFGFTYGDPADPAAQATDMDLHQLGAGLGGHLWFTHTGEPTDAAGRSYWGLTGTWTPNIGKGRYTVKVFIPATGATATEANYTVATGTGPRRTVTVNQNAHTNEWVSLGTYWLGPGANVSLTNLGVQSVGDLAFTAVALVAAPPGKYVMLGDSYSSGEGALGNATPSPDGHLGYDPDTDNFHAADGSVNVGHRSSLSYNRSFAAATSTWHDGGWVHVACSGAIVADFYSPNRYGKCPNELAQESAITADTSLITLTFGGNDLDFAPVIESCVKYGIKLSLTPCRQQWQAADGSDQILTKIQHLTDPTFSAGLPQLYQRLRADAPNAQIVVLGYPHLFRAGNDPAGKCGTAGLISDDDRDWLNGLGDVLDQEIQQTAKAYGLDYVSVDNAFTGHELCSGDQSWFTGIPVSGDSSNWITTIKALLSNTDPTVKQQWFHPNAYGYAAEAKLLQQYLQVP
ncbi:hypothetical protein GCM10029978_051330 [Actinoallomurus acanthiterrae]